MYSSYRGYYLELEADNTIAVYDSADSWKDKRPAYRAHSESEAYSWIDSQADKMLIPTNSSTLLYAPTALGYDMLAHIQGIAIAIDVKADLLNKDVRGIWLDRTANSPGAYIEDIGARLPPDAEAFQNTSSDDLNKAEALGLIEVLGDLATVTEVGLDAMNLLAGFKTTGVPAAATSIQEHWNKYLLPEEHINWKELEELLNWCVSKDLIKTERTPSW